MGYKADPVWPSYVTLNPRSTEVVTVLGTPPSDVEPADYHLALFGYFSHHAILVDWTRCNLHAIAALLQRELLSEKLRLPYRFGRALYDRFNDTDHASRTDHLVAKDVEALLSGTPIGVYQVSRYVTGPLGVLESSEPRLLPPSHRLPLWHCSDTGCGFLHVVEALPPLIPLVRTDRDIEQRLQDAFGPQSEWQSVLPWLHRGDRWETGRPYFDLPSVIGDCIVGPERTSLLQAALLGADRTVLRDALALPPRKKKDAEGPAAAAGLSPEWRGPTPATSHSCMSFGRTD